MAKPRIVILGTGLGGAIAAFEIKDAVRDKAEVSVVSQGGTFHFVPSNPWVAVGWRSRAIEVELRGHQETRSFPRGGASASHRRRTGGARRRRRGRVRLSDHRDRS